MIAPDSSPNPINDTSQRSACLLTEPPKVLQKIPFLTMIGFFEMFWKRLKQKSRQGMDTA